MTVEFKTPCKMYRYTDVVVTPECVERGYAPCGNGDDYKLSKREKEQLRDIFAGKKDASTFEQDRPKLVRMTQQQAIQAMLDGRDVYLSPSERRRWRHSSRIIWTSSASACSGYTQVGIEKNNPSKYYDERHPFLLIAMNSGGRFDVQSINYRQCGNMCDHTQLRFKL